MVNVQWLILNTSPVAFVSKSILMGWCLLDNTLQQTDVFCFLTHQNSVPISFLEWLHFKLNSPSPDCLLCAPCTKKCFLWYLWTDCNTNCMPQLVLKTFSICPAIKYPTWGASQLRSIYFDFWLSRNLPKLSTMDGTKIFFFLPLISINVARKALQKQNEILFSLRKILKRLDY